MLYSTVQICNPALHHFTLVLVSCVNLVWIRYKHSTLPGYSSQPLARPHIRGANPVPRPIHLAPLMPQPLNYPE